MHGGDEMDGFVPVRADAFEVDGSAADLVHARADRSAARREQMTILEREMAMRLRTGIDLTLNVDQVRTGDLGGNAGTAEFTRALVARLKRATRSD
jgi:isocitrate/isopropylmalate dehydrogenase